MKSCFDGYLTEECGKCEFWENKVDSVGCAAPFQIMHCEAFAKMAASEELKNSKMQSIADKLDEMQSLENEGRGISCIKTISLYLRRGQYEDALAATSNEWDKISSYTNIAQLLMEQKMFTPVSTV